VPLIVVAEHEVRASVLSKFLQTPSRCLHRFCGHLPKRVRSFSNRGKFPISDSFFEAHSALGVKPTDLGASEHRVFSDLALVDGSDSRSIALVKRGKELFSCPPKLQQPERTKTQ
jgi:hypothetical protein